MKEAIFPVIFHTSYTNAKTEFVGAFVTYFPTEFCITNSTGLFIIVQRR
jgi:hypothetical protein